MKHYILPLFIAFVLIGCEKSSNEPKTIDRFCGSYSLSGTYSKTVKRVTKDDKIYETTEPEASYTNCSLKITKLTNTSGLVVCDKFPLDTCFLSADGNSIQFNNISHSEIDTYGSLTGVPLSIVFLTLTNDLANLNHNVLSWKILDVLSIFYSNNSEMRISIIEYQNTAIKM